MSSVDISEGKTSSLMFRGSNPWGPIKFFKIFGGDFQCVSATYYVNCGDDGQKENGPISERFVPKGFVPRKSAPMGSVSRGFISKGSVPKGFCS